MGFARARQCRGGKCVSADLEQPQKGLYAARAVAHRRAVKVRVQPSRVAPAGRPSSLTRGVDCVSAPRVRRSTVWADEPCSSATCSPARRSQTGGRLAAIQRLERTRSGTRRAQPLPRAAINGSRQLRATGDVWILWTPSAAQMATRRALLATNASTGRTSSTRCAVPTHEWRLTCVSPFSRVAHNRRARLDACRK